MKPMDPAGVAAALRSLADSVDAGGTPVPLLRYVGELRVVPRVIHDVLCVVRIATPQESVDAMVLHCAFCGLCYLRPSVDPTGMTTGTPIADGVVPQ